MKNKIELRQRAKQLLNNLSEMEKAKIQEAMLSNLITSEYWHNAKVIATTISQQHEWDTTRLIKTAWNQGKEIGVPKCYPKTSELFFYRLQSFDQLESVYFNLSEPKPDKELKVEKNDIDLIVVPGLVFDRNGFRIGYGGGYYDRYLSDFSGITVALAWTEQIVTSIPTEKFDIAVDYVITERGIL